ncbi:MAG: dihydrofolate reductase family protein [Candidatus Eremiobacteraeota bacterium]|nr:dihydrofolate reductase family protein [Candidatus Eremiobacteraeota bacterium]
MIVSVFVGVSVDGFLARPDDTYEFLLEGEREPHGYTEFIATVDAIVLGRRTFDVVRVHPEWPYGPDMRVVVLSSGALDFSGVCGRLEQMNASPAQVFERLATEGVKHVYVDGGLTIQRFLRARLVDRLVITSVPVLIGQGIPLFGSLDRDVPLRHVATRTYPAGMVQSEYEVER